MEHDTKNHNNDDFESLLEQSLTKRDDFSVGEEITGTIVHISKDSVFVDISGKSEAVLNISEIIDDKGNLTVRTGDTIKAFIASTSSGEIEITTRIGSGTTNSELLNTAKEQQLPVSGSVISVVSGGYRVAVSGLNCFCPYSQIDIKAPKDPESLMGKTMEFLIGEISEGGKNIVLTRRKLLEKQQKSQEEELRKTLNVGDTVKGKVSSVQNFGIFIDLGGIEALVPKSEISRSRVSGMGDFKKGNEISAKVLSLDWENKKFVLSIKELSENPWKHLTRYKEGNSYNGTVTNIIKKGAFVELEPGLEGFLPVSRMSIIKKVNKPEEVLSIKDQINIKIVEILSDEQKMLLELVTGEPDPWDSDLSSLHDSVFTGTVESVNPNGINVRLPNGMLGFAPRSELDFQKGSDIQKSYEAGKKIKMTPKDIMKEERRLILSEKDAARKEELKVYREFKNKEDEQASEGSAFGKLFKEKFEQMNKDKESGK